MSVNTENELGRRTENAVLVLSLLAIASFPVMHFCPSVFASFVCMGSFLMWQTLLIRKRFRCSIVLGTAGVLACIGIALNGIALIANGGQMPVEPVYRTGIADRIHIEAGLSTHLLPLTDVLWTGSSAGDILIFVAVPVAITFHLLTGKK